MRKLIMLLLVLALGVNMTAFATNETDKGGKSTTTITVTVVSPTTMIPVSVAVNEDGTFDNSKLNLSLEELKIVEKMILRIRPCSDTSWPPTEPQYTPGYDLVHVNWNSEGEFYTYERECEETYCGSASSGAGCITVTKTQTHVYAYYY